MELLSLLQQSWGIPMVHRICSSLIRLGAELMFLSFSFPLMTFHLFSIGLRAVPRPGYGLEQLLPRKSLIFLKAWQGATSCIKLVGPKLSIQKSRWFWSTSWYLSLFIVAFFSRK
jgi:hypothetical protein